MFSKKQKTIFRSKVMVFGLCSVLCSLHITKSYGQEKDRTIETIGDIFLLTLPATALGTTLIKEDKKGTWQFTKGMLLSGAITYGLKKLIHKERPDKSGFNSFPSGHTSVTFQSASFIQRRYGWKYGIPAYLLAGFTGYSRIQADKHFFVDVLAGAAIGIGSTYLFTTPYQKEHLELTFSSDREAFLVGIAFKF